MPATRILNFGEFNDSEFVRYDVDSDAFVGAQVDLSGYAPLNHTHSSISNENGLLELDNAGRTRITDSTGYHFRFGENSTGLYRDIAHNTLSLLVNAAGITVHSNGTVLADRLESNSGYQYNLGGTNLYILGGEGRGFYQRVAGEISIPNDLFGVGTISPQAQLHINNSNPAQPALQLQGASGQSEPFIEVKDASGNERFRLDKDGSLITNGRQNDFGHIPINLGSSGTAYPGVAYNVAFTTNNFVYNYRLGDSAFMIHMGGGGGDEMSFQVATQGVQGQPITWIRTLRLNTAGQVLIYGNIVEIGPPDSAGGGYRALRVLN